MTRALARRLERLEAERGAQTAAETRGLMEFIPAIVRSYHAPRHLSPLVEELERAWTQPVRVTACAPPRHAKTETVLAYIALTLRRHPEKTIAYVTYEAHTAQSKSRKARNHAANAGVVLAQDAQRLGEWRTPQGGGLLATGIGGPLTSQGVDILLIDDPYKNRVEAESPARRRMITEWMDDVAETRVEPGGSVFIFHTRWHTDDLIAHVHATENGSAWRHIRLPAVSDDGLALWPERWTLEMLREKERSVGAYTWASLYQGMPRPRGGRVFNDVHHYTELPQSYAVGTGVDLAYTARTQADMSIAVTLYEHEGTYYLADLRRRQVKAPDFAAELVALQAQHPHASMRWYCSGTELGSADFIRREGVSLGALPTTADKFVRAQPVAAAWNAGRVLIPGPEAKTRIREEDLDEFVRVVTSFTGVGDAEDDDVDALAAAFDLLPASDPAPPPPPKPGTAAWARAEAERMEREAEERWQREREEDEWAIQ